MLRPAAAGCLPRQLTGHRPTLRAGLRDASTVCPPDGLLGRPLFLQELVGRVTRDPRKTPSEQLAGNTFPICSGTNKTSGGRVEAQRDPGGEALAPGRAALRPGHPLPIPVLNVRWLETCKRASIL